MRRAEIPPGETTVVEAPSALVVAPHYDDETLGCGGLMLQLAARGAAVRVLFLTDSADSAVGGPAAADAGAYAAARRAEAAEAARRLGVAGVDRAELPDGALAGRIDDAAAALRRALLAQRPRLLLAPGPQELSSDHRAAFAAVARVLGGVRAGDELAPVAEALTVLLYEVNRPLRPDLLVDVTAELPRLEAALAAYAGQDARRPYSRAALGLRRFRTLTLPPRVEAAEAYQRLAAADFATRGLATLAAELGAGPGDWPATEGPLVSVVVRTRDRPALLAEALASLAASGYRSLEVVLVNDGGAPPAVPAGFPFPVVRVEHAESRGRAAAANAGIAAARGAWVGFLDDDDRVEPDHFATLVGLARGSGARVVYTDAAVVVCEPAAESGWRAVERRLPYSRDFDLDLLRLDNYIPLHTLLFERALLGEVGPVDESLPFFEDWDLLIRAGERTAFQHLARVTCEYRHYRGSAHHALGERPRERADFLAVKARVLAKQGAALAPDALARAIDRLRAEAVLATEEADRRGRELAETVERTGRELRELYRAVDEQTVHIGRLYAEIERLTGIQRAMESTRAWRLHQWWQRTRGR
jgi:LmbE family N-acetylglucosaminyl deacetylase